MTEYKWTCRVQPTAQRVQDAATQFYEENNVWPRRKSLADFMGHNDTNQQFREAVRTALDNGLIQRVTVPGTNHGVKKRLVPVRD